MTSNNAIWGTLLRKTLYGGQQLRKSSLRERYSGTRHIGGAIQGFTVVAQLAIPYLFHADEGALLNDVEMTYQGTPERLLKGRLNDLFRDV